MHSSLLLHSILVFYDIRRIIITTNKEPHLGFRGYRFVVGDVMAGEDVDRGSRYGCSGI